MTHPGSLIRWGALGAVVLLVRAIVRESRAQRAPTILLPPAGARAGSRRRAGRKARARPEEPEDWDVVEAAAEEADSASGTTESSPASGAAESSPASGAAESGPASGPATTDSKPARE